MKKLILMAGILLSLGINSAHAAIYDITTVLDGSDGFGSSIFSTASTSAPQSTTYDLGYKVSEISNISDPSLLAHTAGTYNSVTGALSIELHHIEAIFGADPATATIPTHSNLTGNMMFDANGLLIADSTLLLDFVDGASNPMIDGTLGFKAGYVCCGSNNSDPNTFMEQTDGSFWLTLAGANINAANPWDGFYDDTTNLALNLRLGLTEQQAVVSAVPVPAAAWLMASGLLGLVGVARRKTV